MTDKLKNMMGTSRRLLALLLSLVMVTSFLPTSAFAQGSGGSNVTDSPDTPPGTSNTAPGVSTLMLAKVPPVGLPEVDAYWPSFRGNNTNMAITDAPLPIDSININLKWNTRLGSGWDAAPSNQIIVGDCLVVMGGKNIFKLDINTGEIVAKGSMVNSGGYSLTSPTYGGGMIFCALGDGTVQAFSAETLNSLWVYTDPLGGQSNTPITYADGYVYTGFWNSETSEASYVALPITDENPEQPNEAKAAQWTLTNTGGFYWAGAVVIGDAVIFGTDDGVSNAYSGEGGPSTLYSCNRLTGEVISSLELIGDQRSSVAYDRDNGKVYLTTKQGYLYSAEVDIVTGELSGLVGNMVSSGKQSTSTPVVYKDRVYIGVGKGFGNGSFVAADGDTLELLYSLPLKGYPQCSMLMTTAYEETSGYIYLYSTYNNQPGGITMIKVKPDAISADDAELIDLYDAAGFQQYCMASLICGPDGTIYYKNDSSNVLAVGVPKATGVINLIASIGKVTLASADAITIARNAYDALPDGDKAAVTNYELLTSAEAVLTQLQQQQRVDDVKKLIADIGTVSKNSGSRIRAARKAYDALASEEKALVTSYNDLTAAERKYNKLTSQSASGKPPVPKPTAQPTPAAVPPYTAAPASVTVIDKISAMLPAEVHGTAQVVELYKLYAQLTTAQKAEILNYEVLETQMADIGKRNHTDSISTITLDGADWNIKLNVQSIQSTDSTHALLAESLGSNTLLFAWDISLSDILTDGKHTPEKELTLRMPTPDLGGHEDIIIAHYKDDGSVEYLDCEIIDGMLTWQVSSFSYYAVVARAKEATTPLPQTGLPTVTLPEPSPEPVAEQTPTLPWLWILLACVGVAAVVVAALARSGKIFVKSEQ